MGGRKQPNKPSQRRQGDRPAYIPNQCETCQGPLVYADSLTPERRENWWYDEFVCPKCNDGTYMDWPKAVTERIQADMKGPTYPLDRLWTQVRLRRLRRGRLPRQRRR